MASSGSTAPGAPTRRDLVLLAVFAPFAAYWVLTAWQGGPEPWSALGVDCRIYIRGAAAWVHGTDPWAAEYLGLHFAALPPAVLLFAPFTIVPEQAFVWGWLTASAAAAVFIVRRAGLSPVWLAFPPLVQGVLNGNPAIVMLALVLTPAAPLGLLVRPQLGFGVLGELRWRALGVAAALGVASLAAAPWGAYFGRDVAGRWGVEGGVGDLRLLAAAAVAVGLLALRDSRYAGWLASATIWPVNGFYGASAVLPVARVWFGALLALPFAPMAPVVAVLAAVLAYLPAPILRRVPWLELAPEPSRSG